LTTGLLTASPGFKVLIEPHSTVLARPDGRRAELRKGLTLTARMVVAQRSLLQLLYDEAGGWTQLLN
jgi:HlyD family secretion protein